jgi:hypothetical protein
MYILDKVQEELRDPRYSEHVSRGTETGPLEEYNYKVKALFIRDRVTRAHEWLKTPEAAERLEDYAGQCVIVSGDSVLGHGYTWREAYEMAAETGVNPRAMVSVRLPKGLLTI